MNGLDLSEAALQRMVVDLAKWADYMVFHVYDSRRSTGKGFPDLVLLHIRTGRLIFVELKREVGRVRPEQKVWLHYLGLQHEAYLWRPSDWTSGLIRQVLTAETVEAVA